MLINTWYVTITIHDMSRSQYTLTGQHIARKGCLLRTTGLYMNTRLKHATWQHMAIKVMRNTTQHNQDIKLNTLHSLQPHPPVHPCPLLLDNPLPCPRWKTNIELQKLCEGALWKRYAYCTCSCLPPYFSIFTTGRC